MRILGILGYGFMALVLAGGWGFLFWQSKAVDLAAVEGARAALAELRTIDAGWNQRLVAARLNPDAGAGTAAPPPVTRYRVPFARFEARALALGDARLGTMFAGLRRALEEKASLTDRYIATRDEALFEQAWSASTGPRMDLLARAIDRSYDDELTQAELYRIALLYYSGFLLAVLAFLVWSLHQSRRQLHEANEQLELRVAERTRELSDALARLKESEAMLIQSEKMSSLGQMVAGIAHEVNTPLAYVKSSLESVRREVPELARLAAETGRLLDLLSAANADETTLAAQFAQVRALLEELRGRATLDQLENLVKDGVFGIAQISEVIGNLKNFSRLDRSKVADYDLHEGIESSIRIGHAQLDKRSVRKEFGDIPRVSCSPSQINQVILNLLSNAAQATKEGEGVIVVRTRRLDTAHVAIDVADNGSGISPEVLPKIFDPFFTTKAVGKGTGLGLSICYKIAQSHGGRLEVQSRPGVGTRFSLVLPLVPPPQAAGTA
ncbi:MAG: sensor histidine kinase [Burkholderiales bacterium]